MREATSGAGSAHAEPVPAGWLVPDWPVAPHVHAFVTTREGGVSTGPFASLNLGLGRTLGRDDPAAVAENRRRVEAHLPRSPAWLAQVHGAHVVALDAPPVHVPAADGSVTRAAGVPLTVLVADCMPVLLADRDGTVVGIAHAGWRGLAAGVVENAVAAMQCAAAELCAWLGPCIGPDAFEVGREVVDAFVAHDARARARFRATREGKWLADLPGLARDRLATAGVRAVSGGSWCTVSDATRFFSYRRDGATGRMAAFLWLGDRTRLTVEAPR